MQHIKIEHPAATHDCISLAHDGHRSTASTYPNLTVGEDKIGVGEDIGGELNEKLKSRLLLRLCLRHRPEARGIDR